MVKALDAIGNRIKQTNQAVAMFGLLGLIAGLFLLWLSVTEGRLDLPKPWSQVANDVGGLLIASVALAAGWELFGKRSFADEVMAKAHLAADVERSGIQAVTDAYLDSVPWPDLFSGATKVDIVVAYASTWRNTHHHRLSALAKTKGARVRVFLPDPEDPLTMQTLANRFGKTPADVQAKINEAVQEFGDLAQADGADFRVYVRPGDVVFSCYRFDARAVLTLYSHSRERRSSVPTFVMGPGDLWEFVYNETAAILSQSRQVRPEEEATSP